MDTGASVTDRFLLEVGGQQVGLLIHHFFDSSRCLAPWCLFLFYLFRSFSPQLEGGPDVVGFPEFVYTHFPSDADNCLISPPVLCTGGVITNGIRWEPTAMDGRTIRKGIYESLHSKGYVEQVFVDYRCCCTQVWAGSRTV